MGVYIKDMEMPECCGYCPFEYKNYCMAKPSLKVESAYRHTRCPLVPVPPHGRLIDEDEVRRLIAEMIPVAKDIINSKAILEWVAEYLPQCHAVIEAEDAER